MAAGLRRIEVSADGVVGTSGERTHVSVFEVVAGSGAAATAIFYNNTSAAGTVVARCAAPAGAADRVYVNVECDLGVYCDISGSGAVAAAYVRG